MAKENKTNERNPKMEKVVSLCKRRGFIFQSSELYGGWNGFWDYGPLGAELKRNLRDLWWKHTVSMREDVVGLDASIIMHPAIWKASGHVDTFNDPMCSCGACKKLVRADQVWQLIADSRWYPPLAALYDAANRSFDQKKLEHWMPREGAQHVPNIALLRNPGAVIEQTRKFLAEAPAPLSEQDFVKLLATDDPSSGALATPCPYCGAPLSEPRPFNLMLKTHTGPIANDDNLTYLRPETAQAIFAQFKNVLDSSRVKVPFGIAQIGKAFRNEITPRNFTFRSREFEQMELEFFILPDEAVELLCGRVARYEEGMDLSRPQPDWGWEVWHRYWVKQRLDFFKSIGFGESWIEQYWQKPEELAHYARATVDLLFKFPFGTEELEGIAARGDFDLSQHQKHSGKSVEVFDEELKNAAAKLGDGEKEAFIQKTHAARRDPATTPEETRAYCEKLFSGFFIPHVIEPSLGLDRLALAVLTAGYCEQEIRDAKGNPETRTLMVMHPALSPVKCAVMPLLKNRPELVAEARGLYEKLRVHFRCAYDDSGAIGRRYRRQDEIGTPFCVTVDFDSIGENGPEKKGTYTLRFRDSMEQVRLDYENLVSTVWLALNRPLRNVQREESEGRADG